MNERIRELMWDAGLNSNYVEGFDSIYSEQLEKFAELVVRECADVAFLEANSRKTQRAVLQHFGVEE